MDNVWCFLFFFLSFWKGKKKIGRGSWNLRTSHSFLRKPHKKKNQQSTKMAKIDNAQRDEKAFDDRFNDLSNLYTEDTHDAYLWHTAGHKDTRFYGDVKHSFFFLGDTVTRVLGLFFFWGGVKAFKKKCNLVLNLTSSLRKNKICSFLIKQTSEPFGLSILFFLWWSNQQPPKQQKTTYRNCSECVCVCLMCARSFFF